MREPDAVHTGAPNQSPQPRNSRLVRTVVFEETRVVGADAESVDLGKLMSVFSELFDSGAHAVEAAGFSLDECVLDRFLRCRLPDGKTREIPVAFLADATRFLHGLERSAAAIAGGPVARLDLWIESLLVRATVEQIE